MVKTWDISGFTKTKTSGGNHYENTCQKLLWTGIKYLHSIHDPKSFFAGTHSLKNVYGLTFTPERLKELENLMSKAVDGDWTGAQHQAVIGHLRFIAENGYKKWFAELKQDRKPEQCLEFDLDKMEMVILK